jgi:hypothetical protein
MSYIGSEPYPTNIPPGSNIPLTALDTPTQNLVNGALQKANNLSDVASKPTSCTNLGAVQKAGDIMTGALTVPNLVTSQGIAAIRIIGGNYGALWHSDGTSLYLLATASGDQNGTWTSYRPIVYTFASGRIGIDQAGQGCTIGSYGGADTTVNSRLVVATNGSFAQLMLNANGYAPIIRASNQSGGIEFINSANTAVNMTISDAGVANFRGGVSNMICATGGLQINAAISNPGNGQGSYVSWNESGGQGETNFINNHGGGIGGFTFRSVNANNTVQSMTIQFDSGGSIHATSFVQSSDYRLKTNVSTMDTAAALARIMQARPVDFEWIESGKASRGFLAHELAEAEPVAVTGEKDATTTDLCGNVAIVPQGVDQTPLIADLVAAVQALTARVAELEAR